MREKEKMIIWSKEAIAGKYALIGQRAVLLSRHGQDYVIEARCGDEKQNIALSPESMGALFTLYTVMGNVERDKRAFERDLCRPTAEAIAAQIAAEENQ